MRSNQINYHTFCAVPIWVVKRRSDFHVHADRAEPEIFNEIRIHIIIVRLFFFFFFP